MGSSNRAPSRATGIFGAFLAVLALTCTNCLTLSLDGADLPTFVNLFPRPCPRVEDLPLSETKSILTRSQAMHPSRHTAAKPVAETHGPQHWLAVMAASLGMLLSVTFSPDAANAQGYQFGQTIAIPQAQLEEKLKEQSGYQRAKLRSARRTAQSMNTAASSEAGGFGDLLVPAALGVGAIGVPAAAGVLYFQVIEDSELEEEKRRIESQQKQKAAQRADLVPVVGGGVAALVLGMSVMSTDTGFQAVTPVSEQSESTPAVLPAAAPPTATNLPPAATSASPAVSVPAVPIKPAVQPESPPKKPETPVPDVKQEAPPKSEAPKPKEEVQPKAQAPVVMQEPAKPTPPITPKLEVKKPAPQPVPMPGKTSGAQQNKAGLGVGAMVLIGAGAVLVTTAEEEEAAAIA